MKANQYLSEVKAVYSKKIKQNEKIKIKGAEKVFKLFQDLQDETQEKFITLHLAGDNSIVCFQVVHIGTNTWVGTNPGDILRTTLLTGATSIILVHNHPSGNPKPSKDDKATTYRIKEACVIMNIRLLDHIIIGDDTFYSFADHTEDSLKT